ncbi:MAG: HEAT repeat domain-containing protein, partial [Phycisphaerae bacterium]|nr:HEAT repeat domain-containing protein [Phycisphaerae bacterium]
VRSAAAKELGARAADMAVLLPSLHQMATNTAAHSRYERAAVCEALGTYHDPASVPTLVTCLTDPESLVRWQASIALFPVDTYADYKAAAMAEITNILIAVASTAKPPFPYTDDDPYQNSHTRMARLAFGMLLKDHNLVGLDRAILFAAARAVAQAPDQLERGWLNSGGFYDKLTYDEMLQLADVFVQLTRYRSPANSMGGYDDKAKVLQLMEQYDVAEGIPSCEVFGEYFSPSLAAERLQGYAGQCLTVEPDPETIQWLYGQHLEAKITVSNVIDAIMGDASPAPLRYWKEIYAVSADHQVLRLPANATMLHVDATNHALRTASADFYTWRKVFGPGAVIFSASGTADAKDVAVSLIDGEPGPYRFEVTMSDAHGYTIVRDTVDVILYGADGAWPSNSAPTADPQALAAGTGVDTLITLTGSDPEGGYLGFDVTSEPAYGTLSGSAPYPIYKSDYGYEGEDSFVFEVVDGGGLIATATVSITVSAANVGATVYEPFDYPEGPLLGQSGATEVGLEDVWVCSHNATGHVVTSSSWSYAALPAMGKSMYTVSGAAWITKSRLMSQSALSRDAVFDDGNELWFSLMLAMDSSVGANDHFYFGLDGGANGANVGFYLSEGVDLRALANDQSGVYEPNDWNARSTWPYDTPHMIVGHCIWGATPQDADTVEIYRVMEVQAGGQPLLVTPAVSTITAAVPQADIGRLYFKTTSGHMLDEIRVGPTYESVMQGTVALTPTLTPPAPNPMIMQSAVVSPDGTAVTLTAAIATASNFHDVEYSFTCVGGGGQDSGWQESNVYTDSGLTPGVTYSYTVTARDTSSNQNRTAASAPVHVVTANLVPVPYVVGLTQTSARDLLTAAGFVLGSVTVINGERVASQSPAPRTIAPYGSAVDVVIQSAISDGNVLFKEDFEERLLGDLDGQAGWVATGVEVQNEDTIDLQAGRMLTNSAAEIYSMEHDVVSAASNVWTDVYLKPELFGDVALYPLAGTTYALHFNGAGHPVAFDGTNATLFSGTTIATDTWTRVTVKADYIARTWDFYIDDALVGSDLGFYDASVSACGGLGVRGFHETGAVVDNILVQTNAPFVVGAFVPQPPTLLCATPGDDELVLSWLPSTGATNYCLKRSASATGTFSTIATPSVTNYTDSTVVNGTPYYYVVSAVGTNGESADSFVASGTAMALPAKPTGLAATPADYRVDLTWDTTAGAVAYNVKRAASSGGLYTTIATPSGTSFSDTGANSPVTYYYVVSALSATGESDDSDPVSAAPAVPVAPAPENVTAAPSGSNIFVWWEAVAGATSYHVKRSTVSGGSYSSVGTPSSASFVDSSVSTGVVYYYVISSVNASDESTNSMEVAMSTDGFSVATPTGLVATGGGGSVSLSWSPLADAEGYVVKRSITQGTGYAPVGETDLDSYLDTDVVHGTTYYYVVAATNEYGQSPNSQEASATPTNRVPRFVSDPFSAAGAPEDDAYSATIAGSATDSD